MLPESSGIVGRARAFSTSKVRSPFMKHNDISAYHDSVSPMLAQNDSGEIPSTSRCAAENQRLFSPSHSRDTLCKLNGLDTGCSSSSSNCTKKISGRGKSNNFCAKSNNNRSSDTKSLSSAATGNNNNNNLPSFNGFSTDGSLSGSSHNNQHMHQDSSCHSTNPATLSSASTTGINASQGPFSLFGLNPNLGSSRPLGHCTLPHRSSCSRQVEGEQQPPPAPPNTSHAVDCGNGHFFCW